MDVAVLEEDSFEFLIGRDILFGGFKDLVLDSKNRNIQFSFQG